MSNYRYTLEPYTGTNSRYRCPNCLIDKVFVRYIDTVTNKHVHESVGRCNREASCGYHYTPRQFFSDNNTPHNNIKTKTYKPQPTPTNTLISLISYDVFKQSLQINKTVLQVAESNNFIQFLVNRFGIEATNEVICRYFVGTSWYWCGATVFWQIDVKGRIRAGKVMLYNSETGKRIKEPYNYITWMHKVLKLNDFNLKQCFFGEHLLVDKTKAVAIVESEKTAIIASIYFPELIWLASGSLSNLTIEKCNVLKNRKVILFPDADGFSKWAEKAKELEQIATVLVSDLLEREATDEEKRLGLDIADYLTKFDKSELERFRAKKTEKRVVNMQDVNIQNFVDCEDYFKSFNVEVVDNTQQSETDKPPF